MNDRISRSPFNPAAVRASSSQGVGSGLGVKSENPCAQIELAGPNKFVLKGGYSVDEPQGDLTVRLPDGKEVTLPLNDFINHRPDTIYHVDRDESPGYPGD